MVKDPVCGMDVEAPKAQHKLDYKGEMYFFCTPLCLATFQ